MQTIAAYLIMIIALTFFTITSINMLIDTIQAIYDRHRQGKIVKLKHPRMSIYLGALLYCLPIGILGSIIIPTFDLILILLTATQA